MITSFTTFGILTPLVNEGDDIAAILVSSLRETPARQFCDGDVVVLAETAVATAEGRIIRLDPLNGVVDVVGTDRLAAPRAGHAAAALCDGTVLVREIPADLRPEDASATLEELAHKLLLHTADQS